MNTIELSILSFLSNAIIRINTKTDFQLILNEFNSNNFSKEFQKVIKKLSIISKKIPKKTDQKLRNTYFKTIAMKNIQSINDSAKCIGEALISSLSIKKIINGVKMEILTHKFMQYIFIIQQMQTATVHLENGGFMIMNKKSLTVM